MVPGIPEGFELIRIGYPDHGELYLRSMGEVMQHDYNSPLMLCPVAILRKIENNWKRLTLGMWDGIPRPARFRLTRHDPWVYGVVEDHRPFAGWLNSNGLWYRNCEVQDGKKENG